MLPLPLRRPPLDSARCRWCIVALPTRVVSPRLQVVYDPTKISFVDILRWFWEAHDPASGMGQGNDRGTQYRSGFYYFDEEQKQLIEASKAAYEKALADAGKTRAITTEIAASSDYDEYGGLWFYAEGYHQQ